MINIVLDATMLDTLQSCFCKFNYRFNLNKVTTILAKPLDKGSVVHIGQEAYWNALKVESNWPKAVDAMLVATREALINSDMTTDEGNRVLEVLEEVAVRWRNEDLTWEILGVEEPFIYDLYKDDTFRIVMMGKIDLRMSNKNYTNVVFDHKSYERDFPLNGLSNQFTNYANAVKSPFLFVNRIGFQKSIAPKDKHKRIPLSYDPLKFQQWTENTIKWAMLYYDATVNKSWPMNQTSCDKYNRLCEYHQVCDSSGDSNKVYKLEAFYKTAPKWDVSEVLTKKG